MANEEHLKILRQGVDSWNNWRRNNPSIRPDLTEVDLTDLDLYEVHFGACILNGVDLSGVTLSGANLKSSSLVEADLSHSDVHGSTLTRADFTRAKLVKTNFGQCVLTRTNFTEADLTEAWLVETMMIMTNFENAILEGCDVYGISAWNLNLNGSNQRNLKITRWNEPSVTVDNLEVAQFVYLLLHNEKLRSVIDTLTTKLVLILGRFTSERKPILDAIREELRKRGYVPILFDFEKPASRDLTETITTLAHLSRFIIADITDAKSIPQELQAIVPNLPSVPVQPLVHTSQREYAMFEHFKRYPWVLPVHEYDGKEQLIADVSDKIIRPAEDKVKEILPKPFN